MFREDWFILLHQIIQIGTLRELTVNQAERSKVTFKITASDGVEGGLWQECIFWVPK